MKKSRMDKSSSLGMPPWHPPLNIKNHQESKLGDASSPTIIRSSSLNFVFITLHIMCYAWSIFLLSVLFVILLVICLFDPCFICVGERHTPLFYLNNLVLRLYLVEYS